MHKLIVGENEKHTLVVDAQIHGIVKAFARQNRIKVHEACM